MRARYVEIDLLRTAAIILMVLYHAAYDLRIYFHWSIDLQGPGWTIVGRAAATLFLLLVGVSFAISASRKKTWQAVWKRAISRAMLILTGAAIISLATYVLDPQTYVRFGILHCIGVSLLLLPLLYRWNPICTALTGIGIVLLGQIETQGSLLGIPFGYPPAQFASVDYYPLIPWLGIILLGLALGKTGYDPPRWQPQPLPRWLQAVTFPGRYALIIYFLHQPLLLIILYGLLGFSNGNTG